MSGEIRKILVTITAVIFFSACKIEKSPETLARQSCSTCHLFPDPSLLDKKTWVNTVLPQMAFRMGLNDPTILSSIPNDDIFTVLNTLPLNPLISREDYERIKKYYESEAPYELSIDSTTVRHVARLFKPLPIHWKRQPYLTLLKFDSVNRMLYAGTRFSMLYQLGSSLQSLDSLQLGSTTSDIKIYEQGIAVNEMGNMDPNDQPSGSISILPTFKDRKTLLIDSLKRPVFFEKFDFDNDGLEDYIVCNYGNFTGDLSIYRLESNDQFRKIILYNGPGSRKVVLEDFNRDGFTDIMALISQGDEKVSIFYNYGNFDFREKILVRFPPVYGLNHIEALDFNNDGFTDFITTNGDNADYSIIPKPYHGIRLFENDGKNNFKEVWSYPMQGASQVIAYDFDEDGDNDIAAIAFFPASNKPGSSFIYLENRGGYDFIPFIINETVAARWLVMEKGDFDNDHDVDIFLGACNMRGVGTDQDFDNNARQNVAILVLKNQLKK